ncbi:hypothetical protein C8R45DRAFT_258185 [Mycena sanguinolenta]|nr:hypothetical protein C8R45DRAFT_258185 [Mycena sanguinolenta]
MSVESVLSFPSTSPSSATLSAFWRHIAQISTRTRNSAGTWVGSEEVVRWNASNPESCQHCKTRRKARVNCDRKIKFIFDNTKDSFFPDYEMFLQAYNNGCRSERRRLQTAINKKRSKQVKRQEQTKDNGSESSITAPAIQYHFINIHTTQPF